MKSNKKITIKDIANRAGFSIATVSRYINHKKIFSDEISDKIQESIDYYSYIPNDNARALRSKNEKIIGIIFPDISNTFFATLFKILEDALFEKKVFVMVCNSDESKTKEKEYLLRLVQKRVDAIVIAPTGENNDLLKKINETIPIIIFDRKQDELQCDQLYADDHDSAYRLTEYILGKGHERIAYAKGVFYSSAARQRLEGVLCAYKTYGVGSDRLTLLSCQDERGARAEFREVLLSRKYDAIIIPSPKKLQWFLMEFSSLKREGKQIDISYGGYATPSEFDMSNIKLTAVLQSGKVYANKLYKVIMHRLEHPNAKAKNVELKLSLIKGETIKGTSVK